MGFQWAAYIKNVTERVQGRGGQCRSERVPSSYADTEMSSPRLSRAARRTHQWAWVQLPRAVSSAVAAVAVPVGAIEESTCAAQRSARDRCTRVSQVPSRDTGVA